MANLKGTKTAENLLKSFAGESQARNRYTFYGAIAREEGYVQISNVFYETAENERAHAKRFFDLLKEDTNGDQIEITGEYPVAIRDTKGNLLSAAIGENEEWSDLYPAFGNEAQGEGFKAVASAFSTIAEVEKRHETRFRKLLANMEANKVFSKDKETLWKCNNCGYIYIGASAPEACPACLYPKSYFEIFTENY